MTPEAPRTRQDRLLPPLGAALTALGQQWGDLLERVSGVRYGIYGLAVLRIGYGLVLLGLLLGDYDDRRLLWGPESPWTVDLFHESLAEDGTFSLFALFDSVLWFEVLYHAFILLVVLFVAGWRTRWITPLLTVMLWSWHQREPWLLDGGDNLMQLVLIYLCFADLSARWSLDERRRARRKALRARQTQQVEQERQELESRTLEKDKAGDVGDKSGEEKDAAGHSEGGSERPVTDRLRWRLATVLHNSALLASLLQVSILYMNAGLLKIRGEVWQEGTALYYILRVEEFQPFPALSSLVYNNDLLVTLGSYGAVFVQVTFPLLMLNPITRRLGLIAATGMHTGIGVLMGLWSFSLIMIVSDLLFVRSATYRRVASASRRAMGIARHRITARPWPLRRRGERTVTPHPLRQRVPLR